MPLINDLKDLQRELIDMMDYSFTEQARYDTKDPDPETAYMIGYLRGQHEACSAIYLAVYGGKEMWKVMQAFWAKAAAADMEEDEDEGRDHRRNEILTAADHGISEGPRDPEADDRPDPDVTDI